MIVALRAPSLAKFGEVDTVPVSEKYTKHKDEKKHEKRREAPRKARGAKKRREARRKGARREEKARGAKIRLSQPFQ